MALSGLIQRSLAGFLAVLFPTCVNAWNSWPSRAVDEPGFTFTASPNDWRDVNFYQLLTDRFNNGDSSNDNAQGQLDKWNGQKYHGGDWEGIRLRLDYLQAMGVKAIWISPVSLNIDVTSDIFGNTYAPYHGYQPISLVSVNTYFGNLQKLRQLVDEAHDRGIYVIIDIVINHMGDLMSSQGQNNSIYHVNEYNDPVWHKGYGHAAPFDDIWRFHRNGKIQNYDDSNQYIRGELNGGLDDLRTEEQGIRTDLATIFKDLISATDCDGYRIDAAKHVEVGFYDYFLPQVYNHASSLGKTNFICFGEVFSGDDNFVASFTATNRHNSMLYFPMMDSMENVFAHGWATKNLTDRINEQWRYAAKARQQLVGFLDNHDEPRILSAGKLNNDWDLLKAALTFMYTSPQIPCLYYGTEQAFTGASDPNNREDMFDGEFESGPSVGNNFNTNHALFAHIKQLNTVRTLHPALTKGTFTSRWEEASGRGIYAYSRQLAGTEAMVVLNTDSSQKQAWPRAILPPGTTYKNLLNPAETAIVDASTNLPVTIAAKSSKIYVPDVASPEVTFNPPAPIGCTNITVTYEVNDGPLKGATQVYIHVGHDGWEDVVTPAPAMTRVDSNNWSYVYTPAPGSESLQCVFHNGQGTWDNNNGNDWQVGIAACTTRITAVQATPVVTADPAGQNNTGDNFDLVTTGGFAQTRSQGGFGSFGKISVNYDQTNLYLGGRGLNVAGANNAMVLFLGINTYPDWMAVNNLWNISGEPNALNYLHNVNFSEKVCLALVLGDEWGDGSWADFQLASGDRFGQGMFFLSSGGPNANFAPVTNGVLSQFDGTGYTATSGTDDDGNRSTDRWEAKIPWSALFATNGMADVTNLYLAALMVNSTTNGNDRYISGNFVGASASSGSGLDAFNNFGFNFVNVNPLHVGLISSDSDQDGIPDAWEMVQFGSLTNANAGSDFDQDGVKDAEEWFVGTNPNLDSSFFGSDDISSETGSGMVFEWPSATGRFYRILKSTNLLEEGFGELQTGIPATPPMNSYTDSVNGAGGIYKIIAQ